LTSALSMLNESSISAMQTAVIITGNVWPRIVTSGQ